VKVQGLENSNNVYKRICTGPLQRGTQLEREEYGEGGRRREGSGKLTRKKSSEPQEA
jgi:hypothetical protein